MKIILTAGCSFTKYKWPTWANFISWFEPEHRIINLGAAGSSNETIQRSLYTGINKSKSVDKAFVMWSGTNRYEIVHDKIDENLKKDETVTYSRWNPDFEWNIFYGGHYFKDKHEYNIRWFQNERQNDVRMPPHNAPEHFQGRRRPIPHRENNPYVTAFWKWWPTLYKNLKHFRMTGGEPMMDKNTYKVFQYIIDHPKDDLHLNVTSNMCPPDKKLKEKYVSVIGVRLTH